MPRHLSKYYEGITNLDNFEYKDDSTATRRNKKNAFVQYIRDNDLIYTEVWDNVPVGTTYIHINFSPNNEKLVCPEEFTQIKENNKWLDLDNYDEDGYIMLNTSSRGSSARGRKSKRSKSVKQSRKSRKSKKSRKSMYKRRY